MYYNIIFFINIVILQQVQKGYQFNMCFRLFNLAELIFDWFILFSK